MDSENSLRKVSNKVVAMLMKKHDFGTQNKVWKPSGAVKRNDGINVGVKRFY
jgi:hypothetical protein